MSSQQDGGRQTVESLVAEARLAKGDARAANRILPLVDLTSLGGSESEADIEALCRRAVEHDVAAVCIYDRHLRQARVLLAGSGVALATVVAFPEGGDDILKAADDSAAAVADGADEIDVVAPLQAAMSGDIGLVGELVESCRAAVGPNVAIKLILETGTLADGALITAVARSAVMAGVDFLKTSTGKVPVGATLEAAALLLAVIQEAEGRVGLKLSGGVRTTGDAAAYLAMVDRVMGEDWARKGRLRFGASSLLDDLLARR
ncbi:MAG: deoxyribose-phosphate aldolase [Geminicoccaceae bacterium]